MVTKITLYSEKKIGICSRIGKQPAAGLTFFSLYSFIHFRLKLLAVVARAFFQRQHFGLKFLHPCHADIGFSTPKGQQNRLDLVGSTR